MTDTAPIVFLFTDIEGSTVRWDANRTAMQDALQRHDAILRTAIETHHGHVFKTVGDAFYATFDSVAAAFAAALHAQRALTTQDWSAVNGLRARMAIHAGEAEMRDGDYYGPELNRVARLLAAGHGGQVLVSGVAAELANDHIPAHATLKRIGTFALKDLHRPEVVYQLCADGLPSHFKPLRTLATTPNNLPSQQTSFIGRDADLLQVNELLELSRMVTIVGTGGVGKTRLALAVAAQRMAEMSDGAWFITFAAIKDPELVLSALTSAVGIAQNEHRNALDSLVEYLKERRTELVPDNCEQVRDDVAAIARTILERCPHVSILATSREALDVPGERVYRLPSLNNDDSVRLFIERARGAVSRFSPDAENQRTIENICNRLDGIALAIELAAARVRMFPLADIELRLNERFRLLAGGSQTELPRHQTMRALIDWSYDLLDSNEQRLFRSLSVFGGSFSFEATMQICGDAKADEWDLRERLSSLVEKSLLVAEDGNNEQRYQMLQSIRDYAFEAMTTAGDAERLAGAHTTFFASMARDAHDAFEAHLQGEWLDRLRADFGNLRGALGWALEEAHDIPLGVQLASELTQAFTGLSLLHEGLHWCKLARDRYASCSPHVRARLQFGIARIENNLGAYDDALASSETAVELYRHSGDGPGLVRAIAQLAQQYARTDRFEQARAASEEAIARARPLGDRMLTATVMLYSACIFPPERIDDARKEYIASVNIFRELGRPDELSRALLWWAQSEAEACNLRRALDISLEGLPLATAELRFYFAINIAGYALALEDDACSASAVPQAFNLAKELRHPVGLPITIAYIAAVNAANSSYAAPLLGYARARLSQREWTLSPDDAIVHERLLTKLREEISESQLLELLETGAAWSEEQAVAEASRQAARPGL